MAAGLFQAQNENAYSALSRRRVFSGETRRIRSRHDKHANKEPGFDHIFYVFVDIVIVDIEMNGCDLIFFVT